MDVDFWLVCLSLQTDMGHTIDAGTSKEVEPSQGKGAENGGDCYKQKLSTKYDLIHLLT